MSKAPKRGKSPAKVKIRNLKPAADVKGGRITNIRANVTTLGGGSGGGTGSKS